MIITILVIADKTVSLSSSENLLGLDVVCKPMGKTIKGRTLSSACLCTISPVVDRETYSIIFIPNNY